ncbi:NUMOD4 motif-containing HNH endonuclease [Lactococcus lactis]|uniref:NUMOD4 motif-containing HNH endonuclease n=1 Tax=Lactococcus lactis TaxID=1358 RepID=UPI0025A0D379|nr:NUMOD4 motif-containing HNH endonuclease [Lactococcus lactis]MDM7533492.1 NUMOD4 motif-containing HNH endonuclease [Lactococcus lactis]
MANTEIEWRDIAGFEGQYEVSNTGLIKSLKGKTERIMKPRRKKIIKNGSVELWYEELILSDKGVQYSKLVHRLVAQAFIPNPENKPEVNHLDEDKGNNSIENLEWNTHEENSNHGTKNIRSANKQSMAVIGVDECGNIVEIHSSIRSAERLTGFGHSSISACANGKNAKYKCLEWFKIDNEMFNLLVGAEF